MAAGQEQLLRAQVEVQTGRHYDIGLTLGATAGAAISLRLQLSELEQTATIAEQAGVRAGMTQSTLQGLSQLATDFIAVLTGARGAVLGQQLARDAATSAFETFAGMMNVTFAGQHLFGGLNSGSPPIDSYQDSTAEAAVSAAFIGQFGFPPEDPAVAGITGPQMQAFLDGPFAGLFEPAEWAGNWSNAASTNLLSRSGPAQQVDESSNANAAVAPGLAQAFTMVMALGEGNLSQAAFEATVDKALSLIGGAQLDLGNEQSRIGIAQQRISAAVETVGTRSFSVTKAIQALESVDPYEAATRVNTLMIQLEASYSLTGRLSRMSLLSYI